MGALDKNLGIPTALVLEFEGAAIMQDMDPDEFLRYLLDNWAKKTRRNRNTQAIREIIRERHADGLTDTAIAKEVGLTQQAVSSLRAGMGLKSNYRRWPKNKKVC